MITGVGGNRSFGTDPTMGVASLEEPTTIDRSTPGDLEVGTMVGEYRVDGLLGAGGMGRVYAATHPLIGKRAAVKVLHPALSVDPDAVNRFIQEARAVNQIGHPNIVDIFAFGTLPDGRCYFVMEQLRGESLATRIEQSPLPLEDVISILDSIAIALDAAHRKGIIHRDLKPDNVFLAEVEGAKPEVKLLDFGIAKLTGDDAGGKRTQTGNVMGTPAYISPEQARGQGVDHRTDLYAFGAVAYELLTGELVFPATNAADMLAQHLFKEPPSVRERRPEIDPELDALISGLLAKDANDRPTLAQVREHLRACRARMHQRMALHEGGHTDPVIMLTGLPAGPMSHTGPIPPPGPMSAVMTMTAPAASVERRSTGILIGAALGVVALVAVVVLVLLRKDAPSTTPPAAPPPATNVAPTGSEPPTTPAATATPAGTTPTPETATASPTPPNAATPPTATGTSTAATPTNAATAASATGTTTAATTKPATKSTTKPTSKPTTKPATTGTTKPTKTGSAAKPPPIDDPDAPM